MRRSMILAGSLLALPFVSCSRGDSHGSTTAKGRDATSSSSEVARQHEHERSRPHEGTKTERAHDKVSSSEHPRSKSSHRADVRAETRERPSEEEIAERAAAAYIFGYPLVLMDVSREIGTAKRTGDQPSARPNELAHLREFPDATFKDVVTPNADTLYSFAWIDLEAEPMVLSMPSTGDRYYVMQLLDAWTNVFAAPGPRTTGTDKKDFAIVGPHWKGRIPRGIERIDAPTNMVWLIGRIQTNGKADYRAVHAIQDQMRMTPLSVFTGEHPPAPEQADDARETAPEKPAPEIVDAMDAQTFFARLDEVMAKNPPADADGPQLERFAAIDIGKDRTFDLRRMKPETARAIQKGYARGQSKLKAEASTPQGESVSGWDILPESLGDYGTNYMLRAVVARVGLGANLVEDAVYPHATTDAEGQPLNGRHRYVIRLAEDAMPPVKAFWSFSVYGPDQAFVANRIDRFALGDRDRLKKNPDGSITLYLQADSPGKAKESNWLPIPKGEDFNVFLRLYWPDEAILDGSWTPPGIERVR